MTTHKELNKEPKVDGSGFVGYWVHLTLLECSNPPNTDPNHLWNFYNMSRHGLYLRTWEVWGEAQGGLQLKKTPQVI